MSSETAGDPRANALSAQAMAALIAQLRDPPKSRTTAVLLAIFFGWLGAHKFYLGQTGLGVLYLVFSWTFIPLIVSWIEAVIYLTTDEFQRQHR